MKLHYTLETIAELVTSSKPDGDPHINGESDFTIDLDNNRAFLSGVDEVSFEMPAVDAIKEAFEQLGIKNVMIVEGSDSGLPSYHECLSLLCDTFDVPGSPSMRDAIEYIKKSHVRMRVKQSPKQ